MTLVKVRPARRYGLLNDLSPFVSRMVSRPGRSYNPSGADWSPRIDISESEKSFELRAELPGLEKKDIDLSMKDDALVLSGEKKQSNENDSEHYYSRERFYGKFQRGFRFSAPVNEDGIKAVFKNGVLTVTVPKAEIPEPAKILIK